MLRQRGIRERDPDRVTATLVGPAWPGKAVSQ